MANRNHSKGMLPDEYMKTSLVKVWPKNIAEGEITMAGVLDRPEMFVVIVRRLGQDWTIEVQKGAPIIDGVLPGEVVEAISRLQKNIVKEQRADRGRDQAALRKADEEGVSE